MLNPDSPILSSTAALARTDVADALPLTNGSAARALALMGRPAAAPTPDDSADIAPCDWDDLLHAVKDRLAKIVAEPPLAASLTELQRTASQVRADVLECVAALDQLQRSRSFRLGEAVTSTPTTTHN